MSRFVPEPKDKKKGIQKPETIHAEEFNTSTDRFIAAAPVRGQLSITSHFLHDHSADVSRQPIRRARLPPLTCICIYFVRRLREHAGMIYSSSLR